MLWGSIIDEVYDNFLEIVAQARDLSLDEVRRLADGRVYTGRQAARAGLVDEVGILEDAIAKAAELGGIAGEPAVVELRPEPTLFDLLYGFQLRSGAPTLDEISELGRHSVTGVPARRTVENRVGGCQGRPMRCAVSGCRSTARCTILCHIQEQWAAQESTATSRPSFIPSSRCHWASRGTSRRASHRR